MDKSATRADKEQVMRVETTVGVERCGVAQGGKGDVEGELSKREEIKPVILTMRDEQAEVRLKRLVDLFDNAVGLRVEGSQPRRLGAQKLSKVAPER